jgi:hypothetical protein
VLNQSSANLFPSKKYETGPLAAGFTAIKVCRCRTHNNMNVLILMMGQDYCKQAATLRVIFRHSLVDRGTIIM